MIFQFVIFAALSIAAVIGSIVVVARDGYRRLPSSRA